MSTKYKKDFDGWDKKKKSIDQKLGNQSWGDKGEIWWCDLGVNIGHEQDGGPKFERPILILEQYGNYTCIILPLTKSKRHNKFIFPFKKFGYRSSVLLDQIKLISNKRLTRKIEELDEKTFEKVVLQMVNINKYLQKHTQKSPPA